MSGYWVGANKDGCAVAVAMVHDGDELEAVKFVAFKGGTQHRYNTQEEARAAHPCFLNWECGPSDTHVEPPSIHGEGSLFGVEVSRG